MVLVKNKLKKKDVGYGLSILFNIKMVLGMYVNTAVNLKGNADEVSNINIFSYVINYYKYNHGYKRI